MLRKDIMSFEELDKHNSELKDDCEYICYLIEDYTNCVKSADCENEEITMDATISSIMNNSFDAKSIGSYKTQQYYSRTDNMVYEITYDCKSFEILEINKREAKPEEAEKESFVDDEEDEFF